MRNTRSLRASSLRENANKPKPYDRLPRQVRTVPLHQILAPIQKTTSPRIAQQDRVHHNHWYYHSKTDQKPQPQCLARTVVLVIFNEFLIDPVTLHQFNQKDMETHIVHAQIRKIMGHTRLTRSAGLRTQEILTLVQVPEFFRTIRQNAQPIGTAKNTHSFLQAKNTHSFLQE